jgi:hypothetical protein
MMFKNFYLVAESFEHMFTVIPQATPKFHADGRRTCFILERWSKFWPDGRFSAAASLIIQFEPISSHPSAPILSSSGPFLRSIRCYGWRSQFVDPPLDFPRQIVRHGDFRHLERDVAGFEQ